MNHKIYKVLSAAQWRKALMQGYYLGSKDDRRDGFIHFSNAQQLPGTLAKHFAGQNDLVLVEVDSDNLGKKLKWEKSRDGQLFPHLYGKLKASFDMQVSALPLGPGGHILPSELAG